MSEDSIASDSISCRTEAPLLPPRKRLLAGLKQNGWSSPSSSSCAAAPLENLEVTETLAHTSMSKHEELDQNSVDAADRGSLQSLNCAAESVDSHHKSQRKSKRHRASFLLTMKKSSKKKKKKVGTEIESLKDSDTKVSSVPDKVKTDATPLSADEKMKAVEDVAGKVSSEGEQHAITLEERDKKEDEGDLVEHATAPKPGSNPSSIVKEEEEATRNPGNTANKGETIITTPDEALKPRRNPNRQHQSRNKDAEQKKQEVQHDKSSQTHLPVADEELARQLHRAMNSSPRIARCLSHKEERPLLSSSRKRYPGS